MSGQVAEFWDKNLKIRSKKTTRLSWLESPIILHECLDLLPLEDRKVSVEQWLSWFKEKYLTETVNLGLSLGAGDGTLERHAILLDMCHQMEAFDISPLSIQTAFDFNKEQDLHHKINLEVADLNTIVLEENKYDVIFGSMIIHHIKNLENLFTEIKRSLKPGGFLVVNEYIGPSQFQMTDEQIEPIEKILDLLPDHLKRDIHSGDVRKFCPQPSIEYMNENDPSEAVRSAEIVKIMEEKLQIIEKVDYGGTIMHQLLHGIIDNFDDHNQEHVSLIKLIRYLEEELISNKIIDNEFSVIVATP